jgi:hypothetical protein
MIPADWQWPKLVSVALSGSTELGPGLIGEANAGMALAISIVTISAVTASTEKMRLIRNLPYLL